MRFDLETIVAIATAFDHMQKIFGTPAGKYLNEKKVAGLEFLFDGLLNTKDMVFFMIILLLVFLLFFNFKIYFFFVKGKVERLPNTSLQCKSGSD